MIILFVFSILFSTVVNLSLPNTSFIINDFIYEYSYCILYFLIGYYLKDNLSKININKYVFLVIYFVMVFLSIISVKFIELDSNKSLLFLSSLSYNSIFVFFASVAFFIFIMRLNLKRNNILLFLGNKTLFVYFVHVIFIYIILELFIFYDFYLRNPFIYSILVAFICYSFSVLCGVVFDIVSKYLIKLFSLCKNRFSRGDL